MDILIFVAILVLLIVSHEFGHFIVAKLSKMRVDEFGIGFGPKLFGYKPKKSETEYTLNLLPFGGFVKIFGEDPNKESMEGPDNTRSFTGRPKILQAAVLLAGVTFNILLAWALISGSFMWGVPTSVSEPPTGAQVENARLLLTDVLPDSPAEEAGLERGDVLLAISSSDAAIQGDDLHPEAISEFIVEHGAETISIIYKRGEERGTAFLTPSSGILEDRPAIGIGMDLVGTLSLPPHRAVWEGAKFTTVGVGVISVALWDFLVDAVTGSADFDEVAGPVGIVGLVGTAVDQGVLTLILLTFSLSISLAVINILPFPALDGGRLLFLLIEAVKGSPIKPSIQNTLNIVGFSLLMILIIAVTFNDVARIIGG